MRKLNKKQKALILDNATINYKRDKRAFFITADFLQNYTAIANINNYDGLEGDIERLYTDNMSMLVMEGKL